MSDEPQSAVDQVTEPDGSGMAGGASGGSGGGSGMPGHPDAARQGEETGQGPGTTSETAVDEALGSTDAG